MWWRLQRAVLGFFSDENSPPYSLNPPQAPLPAQPQPIQIPGYGIFLPSAQPHINSPASQVLAVNSVGNNLAPLAIAPYHAAGPVMISGQENSSTATGIRIQHHPAPVENQIWHIHKPLPPTPNDQAEPTQDSEDVDSHNWPNGEVRRRYVTGEEPSDYKESKWVWRSVGRKAFDGVLSTTYGCRGVLFCPNPSCGRPIRPNTQTDSREKQIEKKGCPECHSSPLIWEECDAQSFFHTTTINGQSISVWGHHKTHEHVRPPLGGALTKAERNAVREQVRRNPTASAHALKTGNLAEGSVPLPEISAVMSNTNKASLAVAKEFIGLKDELGEKYVIDSQLHDSLGVFVLRSPFMEKMLQASVDDWSSTEGGLDGRHGFVTDGNHSFFRDGAILVTSCVFSRVMKKWVPVQYTVLLGQDTEHYRAHFKHIFSAVMEKVKADGREWLKEYGLNTLDYSQAQRNAHAEEYASAVSQIIPGFSQLAPQAQEAQMSSLRTEAMDSQLGCHFHFWNQAERIKENPAIVHPERKQDFVRILRKMTSQTTTEIEFNQQVAIFKREFPDAFNWLSWWLRPAIMNMIFPAMSSVDPSIRAQAPRTTNAAEASHSHIHHALGSHNDLLEGIKKTHLYVKDMEREYNAILAGHFTPSGPRDNRKPKRVTFFENDGRGPDTAAALHALEPAKVGITRFLKLPLFLVGYKWESPNSCFFDNGLELVFRSYCLWPEESRAKLRDLLPNDSFLAGLLSHCERRLKLVAETKKSSLGAHKALTRALSTQQSVTRHKIFRKWLPELDENAHQSSLMWLQYAIEDGNTCSDARGFFGIRYSATFQCPSQHEVSRLLETTEVQALKTLRPDFVDFLFNKSKGKISLSNYFNEEVLFEPNMELHDVLTVKQSCKYPKCPYMASADRVTTLWPQHLTIESDMRKSSPDKPVQLNFDSEFTVADSTGLEILLGDTWYRYDDNKSGHSLQKLKKNVLEKRTPDEVYYVYSRASSTNQTTRTVKSIQETFASFKKIGYSGTPSKPLQVTDDEDVHMMSDDGRAAQGSVPNSNAGPSKVKAAPPEQPVVKAPTKSTVQGAISCTRCGVRGGAAVETIKCVLCQAASHLVCVRHLLPSHYSHLSDALDDISGYHFACSQCLYTPNGRWDQLMLDCFVLVDINKNTHPPKEPAYYPARIISRDGALVALEWHKYNDWPPKSRVIDSTFNLTALECLNLRFAGLIERFISSENLGAILWPLELELELSEDHLGLVESRSQDRHGLLEALKDAYPAILQIVKGERLHPITDVAKNWMKRLPKSTQGKNRLMYLSQFRDQFSLPIFPAHRAMVDQYTTDIHQELRSDNDISISYVSILFELVILRQYLGLNASHDAEIYELSRVLDKEEYDWSSIEDVALRGRIHREFTIHEKAFQSTLNNVAGTDPELNPTAGSATENASGWLKGLHLQKTIDPDRAIELEDPSSLIKLLQEDGSEYIFGAVKHPFQEDMSLTESKNRILSPPPLDESPFILRSPQPFPLAQPEDEIMTSKSPQMPAPTFSHRAGAQPFRIIQTASRNQAAPPKPPTLKQTLLPFTPAPKPASDGPMDLEHQAPKRQLRQVTMDKRKADVESRPIKRRKK
ncbi:hypothetical protein MD484_g8729, partial [Candolleomyces efflorescens]